MKIYNTTLLALHQEATPKSKYNKFIKIALETDDSTLSELATRVAKMYSYYLKSGTHRHVPTSQSGIIPANHKEWALTQRAVNAELKEYVELRLRDTKPEWQITAERHGWKPPN